MAEKEPTGGERLRFECDHDNYGYSTHYENINIGELSVVPCQKCGKPLRRTS